MEDCPVQEKFLFTYHITPHSTTGVAPAEALLGMRRPRSILDYLHQAQQKLSHDSSKPLRTFKVGEVVLAENFTGKHPKWLVGTILEVTGPLSYTIRLEEGSSVR